MVIYRKMDAILKPGSTYYTGPKFFLRVHEIGTNATSPITLYVEERPTGPVISTVAPLRLNDNNLLGPLQLGDLWYAIPPSSKFYVVGPSGSVLRVRGYVGILEREESGPREIYDRFATQDHYYITYVSGTYSHGTDRAIAPNEEVEIYSLTPNPNELYVFNSVLMLSVANATISEGDLAVRFYYEDSPLDVITWEPGPQIALNDFTMFPLPPTATTEIIPYSLQDMPIEVKPNETFSIKVRNTKGSNITPASGKSITFTTIATVVYRKQLR